MPELEKGKQTQILQQNTVLVLVLGRSEQEFSLERTITNKLMIRKPCQLKAFLVRTTGRRWQRSCSNA